jgi:hypothetical protein
MTANCSHDFITIDWSVVAFFLNLVKLPPPWSC